MLLGAAGSPVSVLNGQPVLGTEAAQDHQAVTRQGREIAGRARRALADGSG